MKRFLGFTAVLVVALFISANAGAITVINKPCKLEVTETCFNSGEPAFRLLPG